MTTIHKIPAYDQLISFIPHHNSASLPNLHNLPTCPDIQNPGQGKALPRILEQERIQFSQNGDSSGSLDQETSASFEYSESARTEKQIFHRVPKSLIKELGADSASVLYGFSLILKSHKSNKRGGSYWYYDTLDQLLSKRWPYLKRSSLFDIVKKLSEKEYLLISKDNKMGYDRTMHYSMYMSKIDQVLEDTIYLFDKKIAEKVGILGALLFHNLQYRISNPPVNKIGILENGEHKPKINRLAQDFSVSESTVKRQLKALISEGLLINGKNKGCYSLPGNLALSKNGSNSDKNRSISDENIRICTDFCPDKNGSNSDEDRSFSDENGSNSDENRSNSDNNTIYETNEKHIGIQMRNAPRSFFKKEETEESKIHSSTHPGFETFTHSHFVLNQEFGVSPTIETIIERPFDSNSNTLRLNSETALEVCQSSFPINHSGYSMEGQESPPVDYQNSQLTIFSEISILLDLSANPEEAQIEPSHNHSNISFEDSGSVQENKPRVAGFKSVVSFGRTIEISKSSYSKFRKLVVENSRLGRSFSALPFDQKEFIQDRFLALSVRFIESLTIEKRILLLDQNSPDKVLSLIYEDAFNFLEDKFDEFRIDIGYILSQDQMFPFLPFVETLVRGILLFKKLGDNLFQIDEFTLYSIFESLSSALLDKKNISPETKSLFFNYLIFRARITRVDNKASNGRVLELKTYYGSLVTAFSGYSSESEYLSLVAFFRDNQSLCSEEVYFKYAKSTEWKLAVAKSKDEYDRRWHSVNFKNITQFVKFYPDICREIKEAHYDFESPWTSDNSIISDTSDEHLDENYISNAMADDLETVDPERLARMKRYFLKVKKENGYSSDYISTPIQEKDFRDALLLCEQFDLAAEDIVDLAVELLAESSTRLSSIHLRGILVEKALRAEIWNSMKNSALSTDENLDIESIWIYYTGLFRIYTRNQESAEMLENALLDSSLKFAGWFRILFTPSPNSRIIDKYKHIAIKELNYKIKRFIRRKGLDLSRICG